MRRILCFLLLLQLALSSQAFAANENDLVETTKQDILTVVAAGAGGAILGLSTLSFYEKPSKHLSNIWTGAAIGVIAGVVLVAMNSAQRGQEDLVSRLAPASDFSTSERMIWHENKHADKQSSLSVSYAASLWTHSF